eukprot:UN02040
MQLYRGAENQFLEISQRTYECSYLHLYKNQDKMKKKKPYQSFTLSSTQNNREIQQNGKYISEPTGKKLQLNCAHERILLLCIFCFREIVNSRKENE